MNVDPCEPISTRSGRQQRVRRAQMAFYMESFSSSYAPAAWVIVRARVCMYACEEDARGADAKRNKVISEMMAEAPNLGVTNNDEILNRIFFCDIRGEKRE